MTLNTDAARRSLRGKPQAVQWLVLLVLTVCIVELLELAHLPAALMLGALLGGVWLSVYEGQVKVSRTLFVAAQGLVGCLIARSIGPEILGTMLGQWPVMLIFVFAVILFSATLGGLLSYWKVLPGTTAIWGSSPGGSSVMVLMSESFGADIRLVAFMQFLRVAVVAAVASVVSRIWIPADALHSVSVDWFPHIDGWSLIETLAIAFGGAWAGVRLKVPAGGLLVPMFLGIFLSGSHAVAITLPPWLMAGSYAVVGWSIGLRFTREVVRHAARAFPRVLASTLALVASCGVLAYLLHVFSGADPLTAYLATSPGGADSVAIIAASAHVDMPFVMALQTARFLVVMAIGPALAKFVSKWLVQTE
ncbi:AbrB family transcriptional regulator [Bordetella sp. N]|uniref:AbrB family transcriptional regulator n=1 Tax=Bordetella sp. N TaxID=1746199 RepID=UPI00070D5317|nr:AbrB family transcriptional regulator [Bordetella sp. N]ALM84225.1 ammonia monooxygenase [Bordetella sp. N]